MSMVDALRVTPVMLDNQLISQMNTDQASVDSLTEEASSGNQVNQPSDNPVAIADILSTQSLITRTGQYQQNATDGLAYLGMANSALNQAFASVQQIRQIALQATSASQAGSGIPVQALAEQVQALMNSIVTQANTSYLGHPVFGGTTGGSQAFAANGNYLGTNTVSTRSVAPNQTIPIGVVGSAAFGTSTTGLFGAINQIVADLNTDTSASLNKVITTDLSNLDTAIGQLSAQTEQVGAYYQAMQAAQSDTQTTSTTLQGELSNLQQANMGQVITDLKTAQTTYETSLWATSQVLQTSLASFLG
jgi:flagellar hook-associated protein 3 FlgL